MIASRMMSALDTFTPLAADSSLAITSAALRTLWPSRKLVDRSRWRSADFFALRGALGTVDSSGNACRTGPYFTDSAFLVFVSKPVHVRLQQDSAFPVSQ